MWTSTILTSSRCATRSTACLRSSGGTRAACATCSRWRSRSTHSARTMLRMMFGISAQSHRRQFDPCLPTPAMSSMMRVNLIATVHRYGTW